MGATGAVMFGFEGTLLAFAQKLIDELNSQTLLAVPYFVMAATLMERGGVAKALIGAAAAWVGHVRLVGGHGDRHGHHPGAGNARARLRAAFCRRHRRRLGHARHPDSAQPRVCRLRRTRRRIDPAAVSRRRGARPDAGGAARELYFLV